MLKRTVSGADAATPVRNVRGRVQRDCRQVEGRGQARLCGFTVGILLFWTAAAGFLSAAETALNSATLPPAPSRKVQHEVIIKRPAGPPQIATGLTNFQGQPVTASCASCHTTTKPNLETRSAADLDQFHQGLKYNHGNLSCLSCHNSGDYETLRLADTRAVAFTDSMTLCSQCHGPQRRDYDRGLHGGMNGYWDLTRGGRTRNTCVNCHDAHSPAFPAVMPVLPPRDRFSVGRHHGKTNAKEVRHQ